MSKRRNENGQMRREEWEAAEEADAGSSGEGGGFARASDDAIRARKIVTARPLGAKKAAAAAPVAAAAPAAKANPFAGFSGLAAAKPATEARANPFAGFGGLTAPSSTAATASAPSSYEDAIAVLNKEFLAFVTAQQQKNPSADWTGGVKDYVKHAQEIATKFPSSKPQPATAAPAAVSAPTNSSLPSFLNAPAKKAEPSTAASGFSLGMKPAADAATKPVAASTSGFSFGATDATKEKPLGFSSSKQAEPASETKTATAPAFSFGSTSAAPKPTTPAFSFSATPATPAAASPSAVKPAVPAFSFGGSTASTEPKPATTGFGFGNAPSTAAPSTAASGFSFSLAKPAAATSTASSGFSFGGGATATPSTSGFAFGSTLPAAPAASTADDEDDENIGREEATVILKADNTDEDCVFEADKAKVLEFKKDEARWADKGTHPLKVLVHSSTKNARILVRNEIGKIVLNAALYKGLVVKPQEAKGKKTGALLTLPVDGAVTQFMLKVNSERVDAFLAALEQATPK